MSLNFPNKSSGPYDCSSVLKLALGVSYLGLNFTATSCADALSSFVVSLSLSAFNAAPDLFTK